MLKKLIALSTTILFSAIAQLSFANVIDTVDFTIRNNAGSVQNWGSNWVDMGFAHTGDTITGSFDIAEGNTNVSGITHFLLNVNGINHAATVFSGSIQWVGTHVSQFSFYSFAGPDFGNSYTYSSNTASILLNGVGQVVCNGCVSVGRTAPAVDVPEPGMLALLGFGIFALGINRRRNRSM